MCLSGVYMHHCGMVLQWASTLKLVKDWASTKQYIHTHAYTNVSKFQKLFSSRMAAKLPLRRKASSHTHTHCENWQNNTLSYKVGEKPHVNNREVTSHLLCRARPNL